MFFQDVDDVHPIYSFKCPILNGLVLWNMSFHIWGIIIPIDFRVFQRVRSTTNQLMLNAFRVPLRIENFWLQGWQSFLDPWKVGQKLRKTETKLWYLRIRGVLFIVIPSGKPTQLRIMTMFLGQIDCAYGTSYKENCGIKHPKFGVK